MLGGADAPEKAAKVVLWVEHIQDAPEKAVSAVGRPGAKPSAGNIGVRRG